MGEVGEDVLFAGVAALSRRVRARELSPVELAEAVLARAEALAPRLGCFVALTAERARAQARAAERELAAGRWRGALHGIPCGLEDAIDVAGVPTTLGARPYAGRVADRDATVVARLEEAGAILVGKLSMIELGGGLGYTRADAALSGPCRNPWDPARWAGGASCGAGAAVAAGLLPFALAVASRGSLARPAAFCGVTGFRPTYDALPRRGVAPRSYTLDVLGPLARSAEDCAIVVAALAGVDPRDPSSGPAPAGLDRAGPALPAGLRVGVLPLLPTPETAPGAAEAYAAAADALRIAGAILEPAALPDLPYEAVVALTAEAEAANAFEDLVRTGRTRELADPSHRRRAPESYAPRANAADYVRAARIRGEAQRALARFLERQDLALAPNHPFAPPRADGSVAGILAAPDPLGAAGSLCGLPAVALPMGFSAGLPLSLQLVGPAGDDARVLSAAMAFQARTSHHLQRPPAVAGRTVAAVTRR